MALQTYASPQSFKQALEQRLKTASNSGADFTRKRQLLVFDRFLARIVAVMGDTALLKGGLVLELRGPSRPGVACHHTRTGGKTAARRPAYHLRVPRDAFATTVTARAAGRLVNAVLRDGTLQQSGLDNPATAH